MNNNNYLLLTVISLPILLALGLTGDVYAHTTKIVGDYKIEIGWAKEPPIVGQSNAIEITVKLATDYDIQKYDSVPTNIKDVSNEEAKKSDTSGLSDDLEVDIELGGVRTSISLSELPESPGVYYDYFTPKVTGTPSAYIYGTIKNIEFESKIRFDKVIVSRESSESSELESLPLAGSLIPNWIKTRAGWWAERQISDSDFVSGLEYLIKEKILKVPETESSQNSTQEIPDWIRTIARWWSKSNISDTNFIEAIQFLIKQGIIRI